MPVRQAPYRLPHAYQEIVQQELAEMERDGIVEPSNSEWADITHCDGPEERRQQLCMVKSKLVKPTMKEIMKSWSPSMKLDTESKRCSKEG